MTVSYYDIIRPPSAMRRAVLAAAASDALAFVMQRFPFVMHVAMAIVCLIGPIYTPHLLAFWLVAVHIVFVCCQTRTAYGIYSAWRGVRSHSQRDWAEWFQRQNASLEACERNQHVLPIEHVQHVIILPAYKEEVATLRETLDVLASHPLARTSYYVCLGMEEREDGSDIKAQMLCDAYRAKGRFADITYSIHPGNIVGESAGKSSNVNWASRHMARRRGISSMRSIFTVMDADSTFAADYFLACAAHFGLATPAVRRRMMFVPPILFDRNSPDVPVFTRATDIFWSCAGIGGLYPGSSVKIPTSAYSVSMELARFCDFWDAGPEAIGEDLHFYSKAMFETKGNVHAVTVYSPASQCNVVGKAGNTAVASYLNDMGARWTQAVRHMWGSLDFGYCCHRLLLGKFGRSAPRDGYMAVRTTTEEYGAIEEEDDDDEKTFVGSGAHSRAASDLATSSRTPSPSMTAATDVSDDIELGGLNLSRTLSRKVSQMGSPPIKSADDHHLGLPHIPSRMLNYKGQPGLVTAHDSQDAEAELQDAYDEQSENDRLRVFPIFILMTRLYEAHLMIAQVTVMGFLITIYPSVIFRNGKVSFIDPFNRQCTLSDCMLSIFQSPFAAGVEVAAGTAPGMHPSWMMPTILMCATKAAHMLGAIGITATVLLCIFHDCYHDAATRRWAASDQIYREWSLAHRGMHQNGNNSRRRALPGRYLGARPHQSCTRKWPRALIDFAAIPAMLMYGIAPLVWAQACHLFTNKLTYTVSAKSKSVVIVPTVNESRASVDRFRAPSLEMSRVLRNNEKPVLR